MAPGDNGYMGLAVALNGESQIYQVTSGNDILTLTAVTGNSSDFLVMEDNSGTEVLVFDSGGGMTMAAGQYLNMGIVTTAPTTGLTKGDLFIGFKGSAGVLGIVTSTAGKIIKYGPAFDSKTFGRGTI